MEDKKNKLLLLLKWALSAITALVLMIWINTTRPLQIMALTGQHQEVSLPDSSRVVLNAGSEIRYKKNFATKRNIKLTGEAFFEVAPGSTFTVITKEGAVTALGTHFNVLAWPDYFEVTCYTGKVLVEKGEQRIELNSGQKVIQRGNQLIKKDPAPADHPLWIRGQFIFEDQPLSFVLHEIERQFSIDTEASDAIRQLRYTGMFEKGDLTKTLDDITGAMHLQYTMRKNKVILSR